jgi:Pyruvate/2-oxoacid:ferredoxin oxidoreductase delta subunit
MLFMEALKNILSSVEFWTVVVPVATVVLGWYLNERSKRAHERNTLAWEQYKRKEVHYKELLRTSTGFYVATHNTELKNEFLEQLKLCWLYAPDEVITTAYDFLETVHTGAQKTETEKEHAFGAFVAAIRKDLLSPAIVKERKLGGDNFKHLKAT